MMFRKLALVLSVLLPFATDTLADCKLIVASRTTEEEARVVSLTYLKRFDGVELLQASNGRFAISLGTLSHSPGHKMTAYINKYKLPYDSFCMSLNKVRRYLPLSAPPEKSGTIPQSGAPHSVPPVKNELGFFSCPRGYAGKGFPPSRCEKIHVPQNASLSASGNSWQCNRGYKQIGDSCEWITLPPNAHLTKVFPGLAQGKGWACNRGYKDTGYSCSAVVVPPNAELNWRGDDFECFLGFARQGNQCRKMDYDELRSALESSNRMIQALLSRENSGRSCSEIVDLCEKTCDRDFGYSSSPTERECEKVCEEIDDNC